MDIRKSSIESSEKLVLNQLREYENLFPMIDSDKIDSKITEVNALIDHINGRIEYTESRITKMVTLSIALIGAGVALFGAILKTLDTVPFVFGIVPSGLLIGTGLLAVLIHSRQINPRYPFRGLRNDWKWFYPNIVSNWYRPNVMMSEDEVSLAEKKVMHVFGLTGYATKILNESPAERLRVDVQQLYLLHVNEKYKNTFLSHLRTILKNGLALVVIGLLLFLGLTTYYKIYREPVPSISSNSGFHHESKSSTTSTISPAVNSSTSQGTDIGNVGAK